MGHVITMVTLCDACFPKKLTVLWFLICIGYPIDATYHYLGCYKDVPTNRDLYKSEITFPVGGMNVADCVKECLVEGQPYAGLQEGRKCYCGPTYGKHGVATNIACNYTCNGDTEWCGGKTANSVYYTIQIDATSKAARTLKKYETPTSYEAARQSCVLKNGDLAVAKTTQTVDEIVALFANVELNPTQKKIWFGLNRRPPPNGNFEWTDASETFTLVGYENFWDPSESWQNGCVVINIDTKKWQTTNCQADYPFVCNDAGAAANTDIDYPSDTAGDDTEEGSTTSTLALAIVLPIFALCYGGSCLLYCIHKLHRNCKRRKRMMLLEKEENFTEFEPDDQPPYGKKVHTVSSSVTMANESSYSAAPYNKAPPPPPPVGQQLTGDDPAEESQPEPSRPTSRTAGRSRINSRSSAQSLGPIVSSRPTTSEGVHINVDESHEYSPPGSADPSQAPSPPGYYQNFEKQAKKKRAEKRRNRLLENALKEARERRARESQGSRSSTSSSIKPRSSRASSVEQPQEVNPNPRPNSSKSSRPDSVKMHRPTPLPNDHSSPIKSPNPRTQPDDNSSGGSMSSLLTDDRKSTSSPEDPTKMSISDIIKVKMMMKERKKRVKKILTS